MYVLLLLLLLADQTFDVRLRNGLLALQRNDLAAAESGLRSAAELQPENARVWVALSQTLWKRKEFGQAEEAAQKASKFAGGDAAVLKSLVIYYSESGQTAKAAETQARLSPESAVSLYFDAAQPLLQSQKFGEAISLLNSAPASVV